MRRCWLFAFILLISGCSSPDGPEGRAAGYWPGEFKVESVDDKSDPATLAGAKMKGFIQLYATGMKFTLDMETAHQRFTVTGKWKAEKNRVTVTAADYKFENPTEEDQKALGLKLIKPDEVRALFGHGVILDMSEDRRNLTGLKASFGTRIGRFEFQRPIPR